MIPTNAQRIADFQDKIIQRKTDGVTWLECISEYCEDNELDVEDIHKLISPWLKNEIHEECIERNLLKVADGKNYTL